MKLYKVITTDKVVTAVKAGWDIYPDWLLDKISSGEVQVLKNSDALLSINGMLAYTSDYIVNTNGNISILNELDFSANYFAIDGTDYPLDTLLDAIVVALPQAKSGISKTIDIDLGQAITDIKQLTNLSFIAMICQEEISDNITLDVRYRLVAMGSTDYVVVQSGVVPTINLNPTKLNQINFSLPQVPWGVIIPTGKCHLELYYVTNAEDGLLSVVDFKINTDTGDVVAAIKQLQQMITILQ